MGTRVADAGTAYVAGRRRTPDEVRQILLDPKDCQDFNNVMLGSYRWLRRIAPEMALAVAPHILRSPIFAIKLKQVAWDVVAQDVAQRRKQVLA